MLFLSLKAGEYFTVGSDTVVQYDRLHGERVQLLVHAPREVPVVRGTGLERAGNPRPACLRETPEHFVRQLPWNGEKKRALAGLRALLEELEPTEPETVRRIREKLDVLFPPCPPEKGKGEF